MCGVCGILTLKGQPVDWQQLRRMNESLVHRGPDADGFYGDEDIGLGHRRLSIIDLSPRGQQPIWSNDGSLCIIYNGEVYNYQEIRQELLHQGYHFKSDADTEVIVNAIHCWGMEKALAKFIGMFAFAVWDRNNRTLFLARDRIGIKPLYYYQNDELFLFGSELKAILAHSGCRKEINPHGVSKYFVFGYFPGTETILKNIRKLEPGCYLTATTEGVVKVHRYWSLADFAPNSFQGTLNDAAEQLLELCKSAFRYRLIADVPVGLFLSGGIDSSLVSSILRKEIGADIINITIGFEEENYDEVAKARALSQELRISHIVKYVNAEHAQNVVMKFCDIFDEPFADTSGIPTYILSKTAREHVKVALSADGGDEQLCAYPQYFRYYKTYKAVSRCPQLIRNLIYGVLKNFVPYRPLLSTMLSFSNDRLLNPQFIARYERLLDMLKITNVKQLISLMNSKAWSLLTVNELVPARQDDMLLDFPCHEVKVNIDNILAEMRHSDLLTFLPDDILFKVDRASMSSSLESREPLLDHRLTEFLLTLPTRFLSSENKQKIVAKKILKNYLSERIINAPKRGFVIPLYYWLRGPWKDIVMEFLSPDKVKALGILDPQKVQDELTFFFKYQGGRSEKIWTMLNFHMWAQRWLQ
jgi:asparagine synthase (glutamine-hydrolysing)